MLGGKWIEKIDHWGVWVLLFVLLGYILTGYGITKNIMDPLLAKYLHSRILPLPLFFLFIIHVMKPVRGYFRNWKIFQNEFALDIYTYSLALSVLGLLVWLFLR